VTGLGLAVAVVDRDADLVLPGQHHLGIEWLAGRCGVAQLGQRPQLAALGDRSVLGGGHAEHVHPLALEQIEPLGRVETGVVEERRGAAHPGGHEGVARRQRPAAGRGAPAQVARLSAVPVLGLHLLAGEVAGAVADRLGLAGGARREHDQRRLIGLELSRRRRLRLEQALVGDDQHWPVEAGLVDQPGVALVGHEGARTDPVDARPQVGRAQLLGARLGDRPQPPAGEHRVDPLGAVADQRHHDVSTAHAARRQGAGQARRAVGRLAEGDLPSLAVARHGHQRQPPGIGRVHDLPREVH
jgi:hypothetical protein